MDKKHNIQLEQIWLCHGSCVRKNTRHLTPNSSTGRYVGIFLKQRPAPGQSMACAIA